MAELCVWVNARDARVKIQEIATVTDYSEGESLQTVSTFGKRDNEFPNWR
jgi:hypothetical protein